MACQRRKKHHFQRLDFRQAVAANYPFCTIDPNVGVVTVPDVRLDKITSFVKPHKTVPTTMEFIDIAGLVAGASKGEGLGNQFLGHIRSTDAVVHVVRCFDDPNVIHVAGGVNPMSDIDVINTELLLADLDTLEKRFAKVQKAAKMSTDAKVKSEFSALEKLLEAVQAGRPARTVELTEDEETAARDLHLITAKPMLYVANVDEAGLSGHNPYVDAVEKRASEENGEVVRICARWKPTLRNSNPPSAKSS